MWLNGQLHLLIEPHEALLNKFAVAC
ncbi:hypothetical protein BN1326_140271 [Staphylococcus argenteus]|uniref:Uncharacterized protein n=1 Tax=Staphylococcus argenteus TaxID=985002 RepID=A0A7U7PWS1_9STAP|nr:hypothetical protein BN1326_140271 [Staphylococcus argenteus]CRI16313.1 hypothetical protein BN1326_140271 [Staphylococcus argenteus]